MSNRELLRLMDLISLAIKEGRVVIAAGGTVKKDTLEEIHFVSVTTQLPVEVELEETVPDPAIFLP